MSIHISVDWDIVVVLYYHTVHVFIKLIIQYIFINFNLNVRFDDLAMAESTEVGENVCVLCDKDIAQDSKLDNYNKVTDRQTMGLNPSQVQMPDQNNYHLLHDNYFVCDGSHKP